MEEQPAATMAAIVDFLRRPLKTNEARRILSADEVAGLAPQAAGPGTAGLDSIKTTVLLGDPNKQGVYAVSLYVPPHTIIMAHTHRDDRTATVVSGTWYFGYGTHHAAAALQNSETRQLLYRAGSTAAFCRNEG